MNVFFNQRNEPTELIEPKVNEKLCPEKMSKLYILKMHQCKQKNPRKKLEQLDVSSIKVES